MHLKPGSSCRPGLPLLLLAVGLGLGAPARASTSDGSITAGVAALFVDQQKIVEGLVTDTARDANTVRLRLGHAPQALTVSLIIGLLSKFPADPEHYYLGKNVRVFGTIHSFRGELEIVVHDPELIELADAPHSPTPGADPAVRDSIDALQHRVHELEDQVRQLQHPGNSAP